MTSPTQDPSPAPTSVADPDTERQLDLVLETVCDGADERDKLTRWFGNTLASKPQPCLVLHGWPHSGMPVILKLAQIMFGNEALVVHDEQEDELREGKWPADDVLPNVLITTTRPLPEKMQERSTVVRCRRPIAVDTRHALFRHFNNTMNIAYEDEQRLEELRGAVQRMALSKAE